MLKMQQSKHKPTRKETLIIMKEKSIEYRSKGIEPQETMSLTNYGKQKRKSHMRNITL